MSVGTSPGGIRRMRSKRIRPYALTGGRTRPRKELLVEALVSVPRYDPSLPDSLMPESRVLTSVPARACRSPSCRWPSRSRSVWCGFW
jgi:hypothetical protein